MKKLESLKKSKFNNFKESVISDIYKVKGGEKTATSATKGEPRCDTINDETGKGGTVDGKPIDFSPCPIFHREISTNN